MLRATNIFLIESGLLDIALNLLKKGQEIFKKAV